MRCFILLALLKFLIIGSSSPQKNLTFGLIQNYLEEFGIKMVQILTCWSKSDEISLNKILSQNQVRSIFHKTQKNIMDSISKDANISYYGFILDTTCNEPRLIFEKIPQKLFRLRRPWLLLGATRKSVRHWQELFANVPIRLDSHIIIASLDLLLEAYNPGFGLGGTPTILVLGYWIPNAPIFKKSFSFYKKRKQLSTLVLRIASVSVFWNKSKEKFEDYILGERNKQPDIISKVHYRIFLFLKDMHGFNFTVTVVDKWFGETPSGVDQGSGKLLHEHKIDMGCGGAAPRASRMDFYDYLPLLYSFRPGFVFKNPGANGGVSDQFVKPFASKVWYLILTTTSLICVVIKLFYGIEFRYLGFRTCYSWASAVLVTVSTLLQQGSYLFPKSSSGRVAFAALLLMSILLYNYYTSSIISSLLGRTSKGIMTIDELGHSNLEIGIENAAYATIWLKTSKESEVQYIYKNKIKRPEPQAFNFYDLEAGIAKVRQGGFAYHTITDSSYPLISRTFDQTAVCDLNEVSSLQPSVLGIVTQKRSEFWEMFKISLRFARQVGLVDRLLRIWTTKKPECNGNTSVRAVGMSQVLMALLCLAGGIALSFLFLTIEIICSKQKRP